MTWWDPPPPSSCFRKCKHSSLSMVRHLLILPLPSSVSISIHCSPNKTASSVWFWQQRDTFQHFNPRKLSHPFLEGYQQPDDRCGLVKVVLWNSWTYKLIRIELQLYKDQYTSLHSTCSESWSTKQSGRIWLFIRLMCRVKGQYTQFIRQHFLTYLAVRYPPVTEAHTTPQVKTR